MKPLVQALAVSIAAGGIAALAIAAVLFTVATGMTS